LHKNNTHKSGYNFKILVYAYPKLQPFVFVNKYDTQTIDFANPDAVKALNTALLFAHYNISYWGFSEVNLCPPIPSRVDYIHYLADLLNDSGLHKSINVLDIGTGATCIYPLLGNAKYGWNFIGSEIDKLSLKNAQKIIDKNKLNQHIELRLQVDSSSILNGILKSSEKNSACMCNPPFFKDETEAYIATTRKLKGLGNQNDNIIRNFSGTANELWYKGGEKAFLHNYLYQSSLFKQNCFWYTSLVSSKKLVKSMKISLEKLKATNIKIIQMTQGNKTSRVVAWTFLTQEEQKQWVLDYNN
jgi:23S rRNA (adenine1618-N6)-methyltransferase